MLDHGSCTVGVFVGLFSSPWPKDPTKFNNRVVIKQSVAGKYGVTADTILEFDVNQEDVMTVQGLASQLKDKEVLMPFIMSVRKGNNGDPWVTYRLPKNADILPLESILKPHVAKKDF